MVVARRNRSYQLVETRNLRELLCNRGLQLVFLNAYDTGHGSHKAANRGVAAALVEGGLSAVVTNQYQVLDPSAVFFAQHFYRAPANGATLGEARIMVFSTAGLAFKTQGARAGRVIANELVGDIGSELAESSTGKSMIHSRGATDCPFYYNEDRDVRILAGRQHICAASRKKLFKALTKDLDPTATLEALDALLGAYDAELGAG